MIRTVRGRGWGGAVSICAATAGCAPPIPVYDPIPLNVTEGEVRMAAARNLIALYGGAFALPIDERTAPCLVSIGSAEEILALAYGLGQTDAIVVGMLGRATGQFCVRGGAL